MLFQHVVDRLDRQYSHVAELLGLTVLAQILRDDSILTRSKQGSSVKVPTLVSTSAGFSNVNHIGRLVWGSCRIQQPLQSCKSQPFNGR